MDKQKVLEGIKESGVIGVFRVSRPEDCAKAMDALSEGGLHVLEVTTSTPKVFELISDARKRYGDNALIGVGTVVDANTCEKAIQSGAQFVVSPSLHKEVLDVCKKHDIASCPGTLSPTEMMQAWNWGADLVKVFPIAQVGGPAYVKAVLAPLPYLRLVPTGGVEVENAGDYIKAGAYAVAAGGGLVSKKAIAEGRFDLLTQAARDIMMTVREARRK